MISLWSDSIDMPSFKQLNGDIKTDVLIIGGGMAGILCAYLLDKQGVNYVLVEGKNICNGITKNTTAKVTSQHGLIYDKLIKQYGIEKAKMYLNANEQAVSTYKELSKKIDCDFEMKDNYVYSLKKRKKIEDEVSALEKLNFKAEFLEEIPLPLIIQGAIKFEKQAQFNPLKFVAGIAKGLKIYENTFVTSIDENKVMTKNSVITAKKIIVATHFPFINRHGSYFLKMYQHRSYAIALQNAPQVNGMYVDEAQKGMSFRNYKDYLIIGGGDHRTGKVGGNWDELRKFALLKYPDTIEKYAWATQDCMSLDSIPYIGNYSKSTPNLYVATGFNKWGMTSSMVSANILTDMVMGKQNENAEVFSPSRSILRPQLLVNGFEATVNILSFSTKRCPHLGCALKWNNIEHTWDCPCHGSRFDETGSIIDNPATGSIEI